MFTRRPSFVCCLDRPFLLPFLPSFTIFRPKEKTGQSKQILAARGQTWERGLLSHVLGPKKVKVLTRVSMARSPNKCSPKGEGEVERCPTAFVHHQSKAGLCHGVDDFGPCEGRDQREQVVRIAMHKNEAAKDKERDIVCRSDREQSDRYFRYNAYA